MLHAQSTVTITDTIKTPMGGNWSGTVQVTLNNPATAQPLYAGSETLSGWSQTVTVTNGAFTITLYPNDAITPTGTSYTARYTPTSGSSWSETWVCPTGATTIRELRSTTVPTPRTMFTPSQITQASATLGQGLKWDGSKWAPADVVANPMTSTGDLITRSGGVPVRVAIGSTGQVLTVAGGLPTWASGLTGNVTGNLTGNVTGNVTGNASTATALQTARMIAGVSFNGTANIDIPAPNLVLTAKTSTFFNFAMWGDSLTAGSGGTPYPTAFATSTNLTVFNGGGGGEGSTSIRVRMLADTARLGNTVVIWAGRNNFNFPNTVKADIAAMIAALTEPRRFLVLSILNASTDSGADKAAIIALNTELAALYPNNYLDIRAYLVSQYDPGTAQDVIDFANDVPPSTLRFDHIHLNTAGYLKVAQQVEAFFSAKGWTLISQMDFGRVFQQLPILGPTALQGASGITTFTGTNAMPFRISGANGTSDLTGIDFQVAGQFGLSMPAQGRIAIRQTSVGSQMHFGLSDNYSLGINKETMVMYPGDGRLVFPQRTSDDGLYTIQAGSFRGENGLFAGNMTHLGVKLNTVGGNWAGRFTIKSDSGGTPRSAIDYPSNSSGGMTEGLGVSAIGLTLAAAIAGPSGVLSVGNGVENNALGTIAAAVGSFSGAVTAASFVGPLTGNASTATALQTARTIAGVSFNGTANISIPSTGLSDSSDIVRGGAAVSSGQILYGTSAGVTTTSSALTFSGTALAINSGSGTNSITLRDGTFSKTAGSGWVFGGVIGVQGGGTVAAPSFSLSGSGLGMYFPSSVNLGFVTNGIEQVRLTNTGNLLLGTTTDGNFRLDIGASGSSGTLRAWNQAVGGATQAVFRAGDTQGSTNLTTWQNNGGTAQAAVTSGFNFLAPLTTPSSATATGTTGTIAWDANYIYIATGTNTWKRVAIATW